MALNMEELLAPYSAEVKEKFQELHDKLADMKSTLELENVFPIAGNLRLTEDGTFENNGTVWVGAKLYSLTQVQEGKVPVPELKKAVVDYAKGKMLLTLYTEAYALNMTENLPSLLVKALEAEFELENGVPF